MLFITDSISTMSIRGLIFDKKGTSFFYLTHSIFVCCCFLFSVCFTQQSRNCGSRPKQSICLNYFAWFLLLFYPRNCNIVQLLLWNSREIHLISQSSKWLLIWMACFVCGYGWSLVTRVSNCD